MRTVWVLGAGFSQPLGGPQLQDLLKPEALSDAQASYGVTKWLPSSATQAAVVLCNYGTKWKRGGHTNDRRRFPNHDGETLWPDPEGFIDFVDRAARDPSSGGAKRLRDLLSAFSVIPSLPDIAAAAKRLIAAQCASFSRYAEPDHEQWKPYRNWASYLTATDTVVNFNYDRVVEIAMSWRPDSDEGLQTPAPGQEIHLGEGPRHLKLHGSVTWRWDGKVFQREPEAFLTCADSELAIATPGPSKQESAGTFESLWRGAEAALRAANLVIFIGYRFPPSDSNALQRILHALGGNPETELEIFTVLGPDLSTPEARRLRALLRFAVGGYGLLKDAQHPSLLGKPQETGQRYRTVEAFPLYSQDFCALVPGTNPSDWRRNL